MKHKMSLLATSRTKQESRNLAELKLYKARVKVLMRKLQENNIDIDLEQETEKILQHGEYQRLLGIIAQKPRKKPFEATPLFKLILF